MSFIIAGTGSCAAQTNIDNTFFEKIIDTSDKWITTRTGIKNRTFLTDESLTDIATKSAIAALEEACISADELDFIICATLQGDYIMPSLSCMIQKNIGAHCPAVDINAACTGFLYALDIADSYFKSDKVRNILIVCADNMSKFLDFSDRSTCILFGDGAGAVVLKNGNSLKYINITAHGDKEILYIKGTQHKLPFIEKSMQEKDDNYLKMDGQKVFKFAVSTVTEDIKRALSDSNIDSSLIKYFILHQANQRILECSQDFLKEVPEKFPKNLNNLGNTSAASIPILLDELNKTKKIKKGDLILLSAFGGGMTSGTAIIEWSY